MLYCCPIALVLSVALRHSSHGNISMMPADELVCRGIPTRCVTAHARHDASASRAIQSARALFVFPCPSPRRGERGRTPFSRDELTNRSLPSRPVWPPSPSRPVPSRVASFPVLPGHCQPGRAHRIRARDERGVRHGTHREIAINSLDPARACVRDCIIVVRSVR
jgi:hypothetical protein